MGKKQTYARPSVRVLSLCLDGQLLKSSYIPVSGEKTDHYDAPKKDFAWSREEEEADGLEQ